MKIQEPRLRQLSDLVQVARRSVNPENMDPEALYVLMEHISQRTGMVIETRVSHVEAKSSKYVFEEGDVLFGKLRPGLRKCVVAPERGYCSTDIMPLRLRVPGASFLLAAVLRSENFAGQVAKLVGGANLPRVNREDLLGLSVWWPQDEDLPRLENLAVAAHRFRRDHELLQRHIESLEASLVGKLSN